MIVGVPREVKRDEYRVGILPVGVEELVRSGHHVLVEAGAGLGSGLADHDYLRHGAEMVSGPEEIYGRAEMILKVKEPQPAEIPWLRKGQIAFTYFHFAADRKLTEAVLRTGSLAVAYETLRDDRGRLPLLTPMSEVAGRMSIQEGAKYLERPQMGRGILLGGVPGVEPAHDRDPWRRRGRGERRQGGRRVRRRRLHPRRGHGPAAVTSTTSCRTTSRPSSATGTRSASSSTAPIW